MGSGERLTELADRSLSIPAVSRLDPNRVDFDSIIDAHQGALERDQAGYLDPKTGAWVFTAAAHAKRGFCCGNGCRHCPFTE